MLTSVIKPRPRSNDRASLTLPKRSTTFSYCFSPCSVSVAHDTQTYNSHLNTSRSPLQPNHTKPTQHDLPPHLASPATPHPTLYPPHQKTSRARLLHYLLTLRRQGRSSPYVPLRSFSLPSSARRSDICNFRSTRAQMLDFERLQWIKATL